MPVHMYPLDKDIPYGPVITCPRHCHSRTPGSNLGGFATPVEGSSFQYKLWLGKVATCFHLVLFWKEILESDDEKK